MLCFKFLLYHRAYPLQYIDIEEDFNNFSHLIILGKNQGVEKREASYTVGGNIYSGIATMEQTTELP